MSRAPRPASWWRRRFAHDERIALLALAAGLPGTLVALALLWFTPHELKTRLTLSLFVLGFWGALALIARHPALGKNKSVPSA